MPRHQLREGAKPVPPLQLKAGAKSTHRLPLHGGAAGGPPLLSYSRKGPSPCLISSYLRSQSLASSPTLEGPKPMPTLSHQEEAMPAPLLLLQQGDQAGIEVR